MLSIRFRNNDERIQQIFLAILFINRASRNRDRQTPKAFSIIRRVLRQPIVKGVLLHHHFPEWKWSHEVGLHCESFIGGYNICSKHIDGRYFGGGKFRKLFSRAVRRVAQITYINIGNGNRQRMDAPPHLRSPTAAAFMHTWRAHAPIGI